MDNRKEYGGVLFNYRAFAGKELLDLRSFMLKEFGCRVSLIKSGDETYNNMLYQAWLISFELGRMNFFISRYQSLIKSLSMQGLIPLAVLEGSSMIGVDSFSGLLSYIVNYDVRVVGVRFVCGYLLKSLALGLFGVFAISKIFNNFIYKS